MNNKKFIKSLIQIATRAAFADGVVQKEEKIVIQRTAMAFEVDYKIPDDVADLPSLSELVSGIDSLEQRMTALDVAISVISADGVFENSERNFLQQLCRHLDLQSDEVIEQIVRFAETSAAREKEWTSLKKMIFKK